MLVISSHKEKKLPTPVAKVFSISNSENLADTFYYFFFFLLANRTRVQTHIFFVYNLIIICKAIIFNCANMIIWLEFLGASP